MERLRLDATARLAGHAVVEIGTHVEILGSQRRVRVDAVEYDGYPDADRPHTVRRYAMLAAAGHDAL